LAPMVNQSDLAFRLLCRRHGADLCFTQMLHAQVFANQPSYRQDHFEIHPEDRPLIAQFCGDDGPTIAKSAQMLQKHVDAVDLNCGCPQQIAKRGHYGAFLLDEPDLIVDTVRHMCAVLEIPVTVKLRILPDMDDLIRLALRLQEVGCVMITVHGRTRDQKSRGTPDWGAIARLKGALSIPVVANGGIESHEDIASCLATTKADSVMISEAALENPGIFNGHPCTRAGQFALADEYTTLARQHKPHHAAVIKAHLFKMLHIQLKDHPSVRDALGDALAEDDLFRAVETIRPQEEENARNDPRYQQRCDVDGAPFATWYRRHRAAEGGADGAGCGGSACADVPDEP